MNKQDLIRLLFRAFDSSKRGDMTRAGGCGVCVCFYCVDNDCVACGAQMSCS